MIGRLGACSTFDTNVGYDARDAAPLLEDALGLDTCNSRFDNFDGCSGEIVFRPKSNERSAAVEDVSDELKRRSAHKAVRIDAQSDVVDGFAAMNRFGDHELFVFGPGEGRGHGRRNLRGSGSRGGGSDQETAYQAVKLFERWQFFAALISSEHCFEGIGSREYDLCEPGAVFLCDLRREDIFDLVG